MEPVGEVVCERVGAGGCFVAVRVVAVGGRTARGQTVVAVVTRSDGAAAGGLREPVADVVVCPACLRVGGEWAAGLEADGGEPVEAVVAVGGG